jgi:cyclopropane-fatty-acyl-phospholipid synthase
MHVADIFQRAVGPAAPVRMQAYDGSEAGSPDAPILIEVRSPRALAYLASAPGSLGLARAYVTGELEVEGELYPALRGMADLAINNIPRSEQIAIARQLLGVRLRTRTPLPPEETKPRGRLHSRKRDRKVISHHYDVSNRFYEWLLGPTMAYTCAVFPKPDADLEQAQEHKHELDARKLGLQPGMRLLDVGCGWGGMVMHAAERHGVKALGVTLSHEQAEWAQQAIVERGLNDVAEVRHLDYRDVAESDFDAVSSIGLTEHLGRAQLPAYFAFLYGKLRPGGRLLNHCITQPDGQGPQTLDQFIDRYVFPDGQLHSIGLLVSHMNDAGFEIRHEENFREHYARTLSFWSANLDANWDDAVADVGETRARVWRLYLAASQVGFELNNIQLHQVLGVKVAEGGEAHMPWLPDWEPSPATA